MQNVGDQRSTELHYSVAPEGRWLAPGLGSPLVHGVDMCTRTVNLDLHFPEAWLVSHAPPEMRHVRGAVVNTN